VIVQIGTLRSGPSEEAEALRRLLPGEPFWMLDDGVGWAWGYAGHERRVGYVRLEAISAA
jgi:Bacterial dipeptidyl-peptidase Sh3 domain